jgi:hypothetical protein
MPFSTVILQLRDSTWGPQAYYLPTSTSPSNPAIRPLVPATPLIQDKKVRSGVLAERNLHTEKGTSDINARVPCAVTERTILFERPKTFQQNIDSHQDTPACPNMPFRQRSASVPGLSLTPVHLCQGLRLFL